MKRLHLYRLWIGATVGKNHLQMTVSTSEIRGNKNNEHEDKKKGNGKHLHNIPNETTNLSFYSLSLSLFQFFLFSFMRSHDTNLFNLNMSEFNNSIRERKRAQIETKIGNTRHIPIWTSVFGIIEFVKEI